MNCHEKVCNTRLDCPRCHEKGLDRGEYLYNTCIDCQIHF